MDERRYISALIAERQRLADTTLLNPAEKSEYGFGQAVGVNQGLRIAENLLTAMLKEDKEKDK